MWQNYSKFTQIYHIQTKPTHRPVYVRWRSCRCGLITAQDQINSLYKYKAHAEFISIFVPYMPRLGLLSTHADRQSVELSFTVCLSVILCVCSYGYGFLRRWMIKRGASNFARWLRRFMGKDQGISHFDHKWPSVSLGMLKRCLS